MCGVVGLICEKERQDLGKMASTLLRALEYRGYDSTGAAIQGDSPDSVDLRKGVGAPSFLVKDLGIENMSGKILCGQVRWATFGAVDENNAQPHVVNCKTEIYGAHNGNVTNTEQLKQRLVKEGHIITSDNDGEMVVHTIEHFFALELGKGNQENNTFRRDAMKAAIVSAQKEIEGSFAAIIVDPVSKTLWAIKNGSSLYAGLGIQDESHFNLASSDLTSILKFTKVLVPLSEGEVFEFTHDHYRVFASKTLSRKTADGDKISIEAGTIIDKTPVRSRLQPKDTELRPEFDYFMEQEIHDQADTANAVIEMFMGGSPFTRKATDLINKKRDIFESLLPYIEKLRNVTTDTKLREIFIELVSLNLKDEIYQILYHILNPNLFPEGNASLAAHFSSGDGAMLSDLLNWCHSPEERLLIRAMDSFLELLEVEKTQLITQEFARLVTDAREKGNHIYLAACGTSYHAALTACIFFNEISWTELIPILPGEFRGRYSNTVKDNDIVIAISQSGETKDLIDILNDLEHTGKDITKISLVNNVNSTIAQEKSDLVIPLRCGPEIAVPATKSFINQITVFYTLSLEVARLQLLRNRAPLSDIEYKKQLKDIKSRTEKLEEIPSLIKETISQTHEQIKNAAQNIFLAPSIQILATRINSVAKEGSLKIREVVLNHTEGYEGAEFKHGPNTILGFNTVFGVEHFQKFISSFSRSLVTAFNCSQDSKYKEADFKKIILGLNDTVFGRKVEFALSKKEQEILNSITKEGNIFRDNELPYPLIYVTGPDDRDVRLTISQINTHKIRGSSTIVIAEDSPRLKMAAEKIPMGSENYSAEYITLPRTGDTILTVFSSTVALQLLAFEMSIKKMAYLDKLNIADHGVHPDVPKNVSKSITVD